MIENRHIPKEDIALYAMQALAEDEQPPIRAHLANCALCRAYLAEVSQSLALLAVGVEQRELPNGSRQRFLERLGTTSPAAARVVPIGERVPTALNRSNPRSPGFWVSWAAAAALLLVSVSLGVELHLANNALARESQLVAEQAAATQRAQRVLDLLTAPSARHVLLTAGTPHPVPSARAVYMASRGSLIFQASHLAPLASGKTYELWIIPANGTPPVPAGIFRPNAAGEAHLVLPSIPAGIRAKALGVTVENASGSATPTLPIVLAGSVPAESE